MTLNLWSSLMCTFALIIGLGLFFKQLDMLLMNEIKAMLTVTFGFAASCLILSFIWILQKKPLDDHHLILNTSVGDIPNLHPDGGTGVRRRDTICSITSKLDLPPDYEDALINSKVLTRSDYLHHEKTAPREDDHHHFNLTPAFTISHNDNSVILTGSGSSSATNNKTSNSVASFASSIVRNFATLAPISQLNNHRRTSQSEQNQQVDCNISRKISYCQLDVEQLMLSSSPPKFSDLTFDEGFCGLDETRVNR